MRTWMPCGRISRLGWRRCWPAPGRWKIVYFHHTVYSTGRHAPKGAILQDIIPVIDRNGVDVVLSGHNHMYERTHPLCNGKVDPAGRGTVYITTGTGGQPLYEFEREMPALMAARDNTQHGFTVVDVTPEALSFRQVGQQDNVIDQFVIQTHPIAATGGHSVSAE